MIGAPVAGFGQWLHYPTDDVPRMKSHTSEFTQSGQRSNI
jgi:hypothetical protein